jgi:hypothetical protein
LWQAMQYLSRIARGVGAVVCANATELAITAQTIAKSMIFVIVRTLRPQKSYPK